MGEPGSAIVLIHGIGDQAQGSTLSAFNKFFGKFGLDPKAPDYSQTLRRVRPRSGEEISYFYKLTELDRKPVVIAEMFWSDLSAIRRGFMANLRNAWQIAADAPEIIYASLGPDISDGRVRDYLLLRILRCLVCLAFWTIYFPIVASNLAYGVLFVWIFIFRTVNGLIDDSQIELSSPADATFAGASLLSLALLILLLGTNLTRRIRPLLAWVGAAFAAVAALSCSNIGLPYLSDLLDYQLPTPSSLMGYVGPMTYQNYSSLIRRLNTLWFVPVGVATIYLAALPVLIILLRKRWRGFLLGYAAMFVLIRVWLVLITTCWLVVLNFTLDDARMAKVLDEIMHSGKYMSLIWLDILVVVIVFAVPYASNGLVSRFRGATGEPRRYARVVVPTAVLILPLGLSVVLGAAMLLCDCPWNPDSCQMAQCIVMLQATRFILEYAGWILAVGGLALQFTDGGFKVASDIASYFKTDVAHTNANPLTALALAYRYNPRKETSFGAQLGRRLLAICRDVIAKSSRVRQLHVVAHSLGTVAAIDTLRQRTSALAGVEINLVTMGSPYMNIFHHYFPHMFPALTRRQLTSVSSVTNIYREDDYMGTRLSEADGFVTERRQGRSGHFGYFEDPDVLSEVAGAILRARF